MIVIDFKLLTESVCALCFIQRANVPTQVARAMQLSEAGAPARPQISVCLSSPHTHLNQASCSPVTHRQSPTSPAKPFIQGPMQVLASIWQTAVLSYSQCVCVCVCLCQCLQKAYWTVNIFWWLMAVISHYHDLCSRHESLAASLLLELQNTTAWLQHTHGTMQHLFWAVTLWQCILKKSVFIDILTCHINPRLFPHEEVSYINKLSYTHNGKM